MCVTPGVCVARACVSYTSVRSGPHPSTGVCAGVCARVCVCVLRPRLVVAVAGQVACTHTLLSLARLAAPRPLRQVDSDGAPLTGANGTTYTWTVDERTLPPAKYFSSLIIYNYTNKMIPVVPGAPRWRCACRGVSGAARCLPPPRAAVQRWPQNSALLAHRPNPALVRMLLCAVRPCPLPSQRELPGEQGRVCQERKRLCHLLAELRTPRRPWLPQVPKLVSWLSAEIWPQPHGHDCRTARPRQWSVSRARPATPCCHRALRTRVCRATTTHTHTHTPQAAAVQRPLLGHATHVRPQRPGRCRRLSAAAHRQGRVQQHAGGGRALGWPPPPCAQTCAERARHAAVYS